MTLDDWSSNKDESKIRFLDRVSHVDFAGLAEFTIYSPNKMLYWNSQIIILNNDKVEQLRIGIVIKKQYNTGWKTVLIRIWIGWE